MLSTIAWRNVRAHPTRFVGTLLAIVFATMFLSGALTLRDSLANALTSNAVSALEDVDFAVEPPGEHDPANMGMEPLVGVDLEVVDEVAEIDGVAAVLGERSSAVEVTVGDDTVNGAAWVTADSPLLPWQVTDGRLPAAPGEVVIDQDTLERLDLAVGEEVALATLAGPSEATVVGASTFGAQAARASADVLVGAADADTFTKLSTAGWDMVLASVAEGADVDAVEAAVTDVVGDRGGVIDGDELREREAGQAAGLATGLGIGLQAFAYLALVVGALIIFNTFTTIVGQRVREFALLRAVGTSGRQVRRAVRIEALVVATVASVIGAVLGILLIMIARAAIPALRDLSTLTVSPWSVAQVLASGIIVTLISAYIPAWRASRTRPVEALRDADPTIKPISRGRTIVGLAALALGVISLVAGSMAGTGLLMGLGATLLFVGVLVGGPTLVSWVARVLRRPAAAMTVSEQLAVAEVERNARRTAATANALVIGVFLVVFVTAAGGAIRDFAVAQIENLAGSDLSVGTSSLTQGMPPGMEEEVLAVDGVAEVAQITAIVGTSPDLFGGGMPAGSMDLEQLGSVLGVDVTEGRLDAGGAVLAGDLATQAGLSLGDTIPVELVNGETLEVELTALTSFTFDITPFVIDGDTIADVLPELAPSQLAVRFDPSASARETRDAVEAITSQYAGVEVIDTNFIVTIVRTFFNLLISAVNALLGVAVVMALFGILNTLVLAITERTRELGLLRAVGMTRPQLRRTIRGESLLTSLIGTVVGAVFGLGVAYAITRPLLEGNFSVPWLALGVTLVAGVVIGVLAAAFPAWRASRLDPLDAIRTG